MPMSPDSDGGAAVANPNPGSTEKRHQILNAAVTAFARHGYNQTRVSDIADEAGVAYGLVYHYFKSKETVLDEVFLERWGLMLDVMRNAADDEDLDFRGKLRRIAKFIFESYAHNPDVMHVVIVEVTRAANTFGRKHLPQIEDAYKVIERIMVDGQARGELPASIDPQFAAYSYYGAIEQIVVGWIFDLLPSTPEDRAAAIDASLGIVRDLT